MGLEMTALSPFHWTLIVIFTLHGTKLCSKAMPVQAGTTPTSDLHTATIDPIEATVENVRDNELHNSFNSKEDIEVKKRVGNLEENTGETESSAINSGGTDKEVGYGNESTEKKKNYKNMRAAESTPSGLFSGLPEIPPFPTFAPLPAPPQGLMPGLGTSSQGESLNPTLMIGGFSLMKMPMPGLADFMSGIAKNILPMFQSLPTPPPFPNLFSG
ncbi:hypothetical protein C0J52_13077 [Blattella germanica]|nr:hypothetical protein C0J52_13077 [Blattella germanica]